MKMRAIAVVACVAAVLAVSVSAVVAQSQRFPDVAADHYAFEAVEWAAEVGVTIGYGDGTFKPERPLIKRHAVVFMQRYYDEILGAEESPDFTRADMMVLLKAINDGTIRDTGTDNAAGSPPEQQAGQRFPDVAADHHAFEAVEWAAEVGVTTGYTDGTFKPERPLIKRHAVVFMQRYYDEILGAEESPDFTRADMMVLLKAVNDGTEPQPETATTEPEPTTTTAAQWPYGPPGTVVNVAGVWPDDGYAADFVCEVNSEGGFVDADGNQNCWHTSEVCDVNDPASFAVCWQSFEPWTPPQTGDVPAVHPDTPLSEWQRGDGTVNPNTPAYEIPRETVAVAGWINWCWQQFNEGSGIHCRQLLHEMNQALDYLGANPQCVLKAYGQQVNYHKEQGSQASLNYATNNYGWHLCSTVIDPIVSEIPAGHRDNDVGLRLSDTPGATLAQRCRIVLVGPYPDIQLETRYRSDGTPPTRFGQDCDAWAAYVMSISDFTAYPDCSASMRLAEEWMEHHHNQHERYFRPHC